jgi:hypothetical protein
LKCGDEKESASLLHYASICFRNITKTAPNKEKENLGKKICDEKGKCDLLFSECKHLSLVGNPQKILSQKMIQKTSIFKATALSLTLQAKL